MQQTSRSSEPVLEPRKRFTRNRIVAVAILGLAIASFALLWEHYIAPTRIAVVNFRDFQYNEMVEANTNPWVQLAKLDVGDLDKASLNKYHAMYVFGRGVNFTETQSEIVRKATSRGLLVYVVGATNPSMDVTNMKSDMLEKVAAYFENGGRRNLHALMEFTRRMIDGKTLFSNEPETPVIIPADAFFHVGDEAYFSDLASYEKFRDQKGLSKPDKHRVALVTSIFGPRSANRSYVDELVNRLEEQGVNVYPVAGFMKRLDHLKAIKPDLVIYIPHGRLAAGRADECVKWLQENGIPVICPIDVFENYDKWVSSQKGMQGGMMTQNILMPELDGGIEPFAISAQFPNDRGLNVPKALPERMDKLVSRVQHWLNLRAKPNSTKKIAVVYFKGPGQNAMVASGMEVGASLLNLLKSLKAAGYETGELPPDAKAMEETIRKRGPVLGPYAKGEMDEFVKSGDPEFVDVEKIEAWAKKQLDPTMYAEVVKQYGPPPGEYLGVDHNGKKCIALPRLQFGNVAVLPQTLPAIGDDTERLVHGAKQAPPYSYITTYLWARHGFQADAILHFGTHGSLEFTPWKQNALSDLDWPDALIGDLPHLYVYVINNIGEAVIAKRRSYATIVSHLTPPMTESGLYGPLKNLQDTIGRYDATTDEALRIELEISIRKLVTELNLQKDLKLAIEGSNPLTDDQIEQVHDYLHAVADEKITRGLYVLGRPYLKEESEETARLMSQDAVAVGEAQKKIIAGKVSNKILDDSSAFEKAFRQPARESIIKILAGTAKSGDFVDPADTKRIADWDRVHPTMSDDALFARFVQMGERNGNGGDPKSRSPKGGGSGETKQRPGQSIATLEIQFLNVADDPENLKFLETLRTDANYERILQSLDPESLRKARRIATFVPAMREALDRMQKPGMTELINAMKSAENRNKVLSWLTDTSMQTQIREKAEARRSKFAAELSKPEFQSDILTALSNEDLVSFLKTLKTDQLDQLAERLKFASENTALADRLSHSESVAKFRNLLVQESADSQMAQAMGMLNREKLRRSEEERQVVNQLRSLTNAYQSVTDYQDRIKASTDSEIQAILAGLNGRYISPSSGGDAVTNPESVPTGRNLYPIDAEKTPSPEAWILGRKLADKTIESKRQETGKEPVKVAVTLWPGEFINSQGVDIAMIFHFLGVEPVRDARGVVHDVRLVPVEELGRPRIDVVVQTAGQFRDIAATRMSLIDRAVKLAGQAADSEKFANHVREGTIAAESKLKQLGLSPAEARKFSTARIFGGVNGNYGTGIMGLVEAGDRWENRKEIAETYQNNMGAIYTEDHWGEFVPGLFNAAVQNTDTLVHSRTSNVTGPLKLDHVYEFMGGFSNAIADATGKDPSAYFVDMRNKYQSKVQNAEEAIWQEARSTLLNPKYIQELQKEGASAAEVFAESVRNTYGWNAMRPDAIDDELWNELHEVYVKDKYQMGMKDYFRNKNPFAMQEVTAVMLETARKGLWQATPEQIALLTTTHFEMIREFNPACSGFVCNNAKLQEYIGENLSDLDRSTYVSAIEGVRQSAESNQDVRKSIALEKQANDSTDPKEKGASSNPIAKKPKDSNKPETANSNLPFVLLFVSLFGLTAISVLLFARSRIG